MGKSSPCIPCEMCPCVVCLWKESKGDGRGEEKENVERDDGRNFFLLGNREVLPSNLKSSTSWHFPAGWSQAKLTFLVLTYISVRWGNFCKVSLPYWGIDVLTPSRITCTLSMSEIFQFLNAFLLTDWLNKYEIQSNWAPRLKLFDFVKIPCPKIYGAFFLNCFASFGQRGRRHWAVMLLLSGWNIGTH